MLMGINMKTVLFTQSFFIAKEFFHEHRLGLIVRCHFPILSCKLAANLQNHLIDYMIFIIYECMHFTVCDFAAGLNVLLLLYDVFFMPTLMLDALQAIQQKFEYIKNTHTSK